MQQFGVHQFEVLLQLAVQGAVDALQVGAVHTRCSGFMVSPRRLLGSLLLCGQKQQRVDARIIQADAPVQVRAGDATGHADLAKAVAGVDGLSGFNPDLAHVAVHGDQSLAVIEQYGVAVEKEITGIEYRAGCRCPYRRACRLRRCQDRCVVCAPVR